MKYVSTRGGSEEKTSAQAIIQGLASNKGLFVPTEIPVLPFKLDELKDLEYKQVAEKIIGSFLYDFTEAEITECVNGAYTDKFSAEEIVPVVKAGDAWFLELYHGRTSAFKDMALSILPYLLTTSLKKENEESRICILTATSGDTGKAALEGFCDVPGTEIIVFYPEEGVSAVQMAQMVTQQGKNTHVFAIRGNFDDAQKGVKEIFNSREIAEQLQEKGVKLSSANSINIGRLVPQVAYYVFGYGQLIKQGAIKPGDEINIVVPTGNFGNILAAYYAHLMGIPVNRFICASNENKVLTDFIRTGTYDTHREFHITTSPSMDILVSSNLERLLYHLSGEDPRTIASLMEELDTKGIYEVNDKIKGGLCKFYGGFADMDMTEEALGSMYRDNSYLMDTHTAVAYKVYEDYKKETGDDRPTLIASTASPFKFSGSVSKAIEMAPEENEFINLKNLARDTGLEIPEGLKDLDRKEILHNECIQKDGMVDAIIKSLQ